MILARGIRGKTQLGGAWQSRASPFLSPSHVSHQRKPGSRGLKASDAVTKSLRKVQRHACYSCRCDGADPSPITWVLPPIGIAEAPPVPPVWRGFSFSASVTRAKRFNVRLSPRSGHIDQAHP